MRTTRTTTTPGTLRRWVLGFAAGAAVAGTAAAGDTQPLKLPDIGSPPAAVKAPARLTSNPAPAPTVVTPAETVWNSPAPTFGGIARGAEACATGTCGPTVSGSAGAACSAAGGGCFDGMHSRKHAICGAKECARTEAPIVPSIGTYTREAFSTMKQNALAEYFIMYTIEFTAGTPDLNGYGHRHVDGIVRRMGGNSHPVRIEPSGDSKLDDLRRATLAQVLVQGGLDAGSLTARLIVGTGKAEGLRYDDITSVNSRFRLGGSGGGGGGVYGGGVGSGGGFGR